MVFDGAEILAPKPEERRTKEFCIAADAVVGVRVKRIAVSVLADFFGLIFTLNVYGLRAPVVLLARYIVTALQQENPLAGRRQLASERPAAGAGADDDHVVMPFIVH